MLKISSVVYDDPPEPIYGIKLPLNENWNSVPVK
jgi:hypothetical protein